MASCDLIKCCNVGHADWQCYPVDDDCFVAKNPSGEDINVLEQHIKNLLSPSTPYFFNTLYDPYREGADFVRGYPFSLREGVTTAVSHGLWMNIPGEGHAFSNPLAGYLVT